MTDRDTALREVAALVSAVLRNGPPALEAEIRPVALRLGLVGPDAIEKLLREPAAGCLCGITPGAPSEVIPLACPVHGIPCEDCGEVESCKPGCGEGDGSTEAGSGFDSDGTRWALTVTRDGNGLLVSVGFEDAFLYGEQRERFTEAAARTAMPGQGVRDAG
jgi:hypothetical protein